MKISIQFEISSAWPKTRQIAETAHFLRQAQDRIGSSMHDLEEFPRAVGTTDIPLPVDEETKA